MTTPDVALGRAIVSALPRLEAISDADAALARAPGRWSRKEILGHLMEACPRGALIKPRQRHNLDRVAFRTVPADQPTTLKYFMYDYVEHLEHHLAQIVDPEPR